MASLRSTDRRDGTTAHRVYFRHEGRQTCYTFDDEKTAKTFKAAVENMGSARAIALHRLERAPRGSAGVTVTEWIKGHIDHLSGVQVDTATKYRAYLSNDIGPVLGDVPLGELTDRDIARWVQGLTGSAKTVANKQRFLSSALASAVKAGHIVANPAAGAKLPRSERAKRNRYISPPEFEILLAELDIAWRPLVTFLAMSGCRWGEATALRPSDVDRNNGTVSISRAWKYIPKVGYILGPPKTRMSERTIDVDPKVLDKLDYSKAWLFTNPGNGAGGPSAKRRGAGGPVRNQSFARNVWRPACKRAKLEPAPRIHDLRHTCASWMIQQGISLPVIQVHMGHEDIRTTVNTYGHLDRQSSRAAADAIARLLD